MKILSFARTEKNALAAWWWTVDRPLLFALLALMGIGVALVMAASPAVAARIDVSSLHFVLRHLAALVPSIMILLSVSMMTEKQIWRLATFMLFAFGTMMVVVLFVGTEIKGAQRWFQLAGFSLQPSEFIKPAFAIFSAWLMARQQEQPTFPGNLIAVLVYCATITLLLLQPDFGMTMVLTAMVATQIFLAGLPFRYLVAFFGVVVLGLILAYTVFDHVQSRIDRFLDPAQGDNYQIERSIEALKNGGAFGIGPGQGVIKNKIPDAHADLIFSVGGEEGGFVFVLALLGLYGFILWRVIRHLITSENMFVILACGGLAMMFGLQAFVHMGSSMQLLPTKGMTLPFISYGGSSLLSMSFSFGTILALTRRRGLGTITRMGLAPKSPPPEKGGPP